MTFRESAQDDVLRGRVGPLQSKNIHDFKELFRLRTSGGFPARLGFATGGRQPGASIGVADRPDPRPPDACLAGQIISEPFRSVEGLAPTCSIRRVQFAPR